MRENKSNMYLVFKTIFLVVGVILVFGNKYFMKYFNKSFISTISMTVLASIFAIGGMENYKSGDTKNAKRYFMIAAGIMILSVLTLIF